jgi:aquaporin Z
MLQNALGRSGWSWVVAAARCSPRRSPDVGIGLLGVSLAFGLTVLTMAVCDRAHLGLPPESGGVGRALRRRTLSGKPVAALHRRAGRGRGIVAGGVLYLIASGKAGFDVAGGFASNGFGEHSPGGYSMVSALVTEVVMTMMFLLVILGATDKRAPAGMAPIAIGLCLTLIHLISIPSPTPR